MLERSGAEVRLHTPITSITSHHDGGYTLETHSCGSKTRGSGGVSRHFDIVVFAAPFQFSKVKDLQGLINPSIEEIPYKKLHVTLFASPLRFNPTYYGLSREDTPEDVYTTLAPGDNSPPGPDGVGKAMFFSFQIWQTGINPKTSKEEFIYKIFSDEKVTPDFLSSVFGVQIPPTFVGKPGTDAQGDGPISWYYPHVWDAFPIGSPRTTFQSPVLAEGLYYTSGIESFISTMETSALMGKNIAQLIVDSFDTGSADIN